MTSASRWLLCRGRSIFWNERGGRGRVGFVAGWNETTQDCPRPPQAGARECRIVRIGAGWSETTAALCSGLGRVGTRGRRIVPVCRRLERDDAGSSPFGAGWNERTQDSLRSAAGWSETTQDCPRLGQVGARRRRIRLRSWRRVERDDAGLFRFGAGWSETTQDRSGLAQGGTRRRRIVPVWGRVGTRRRRIVPVRPRLKRDDAGSFRFGAGWNKTTQDRPRLRQVGTRRRRIVPLWRRAGRDDAGSFQAGAGWNETRQGFSGALPVIHLRRDSDRSWPRAGLAARCVHRRKVGRAEWIAKAPEALQRLPRGNSNLDQRRSTSARQGTPRAK